MIKFVCGIFVGLMIGSAIAQVALTPQWDQRAMIRAIIANPGVIPVDGNGYVICSDKH